MKTSHLLLVCVLLIAVAAGWVAGPAPAAADDALLLPAGTLRITAAATATEGQEVYDIDGNLQDAPNIELFTASGAVEFGVTDTILAAIKWVPGYNLGWNMEGEENVRLDVPSGATLGLKYGLVGEDRRYFSNRFRAAVAPGVTIPTAWDYDAKEEQESFIAGNEYRIPSDPIAVAAGLRVYGDYLFNDAFFLNGTTELTYRFPVPIEQTPVDVFSNASAEGADTVNYGAKLAVEFEPRYYLRPGMKLRLGAGCPVIYTYESPVESDQGTEIIQENELITLGPSFSAFLAFLPIPIEARLEMAFAADGRNRRKINKFSFILSSYSRF